MKKKQTTPTEATAFKRKPKPEGRERYREGLGRPNNSVSDLRSVQSLRNAYRKDLERLTTVTHLLGWVSVCIARSLKDPQTKHSFASALYATDAHRCVNRVTTLLDTLVKERSPRPDAGASPEVLARARAKALAKKAARKGGAL